MIAIVNICYLRVLYGFFLVGLRSSTYSVFQIDKFIGLFFGQRNREGDCKRRELSFMWHYLLHDLMVLLVYEEIIIRSVHWDANHSIIGNSEGDTHPIQSKWTKMECEIFKRRGALASFMQELVGPGPYLRLKIRRVFDVVDYVANHWQWIELYKIIN